MSFVAKLLRTPHAGYLLIFLCLIGTRLLHRLFFLGGRSRRRGRRFVVAETEAGDSGIRPKTAYHQSEVGLEGRVAGRGVGEVFQRLGLAGGESTAVALDVPQQLKRRRRTQRGGMIRLSDERGQSALWFLVIDLWR